MHRASDELRVAAGAALVRRGIAVRCGRSHARQNQLHLDRSAGALT